MRNLITTIDQYLEGSNRQAMGAVEANALLARTGLLKDSVERPGQPLRKLLRAGKFPHAYQQGSTWVIPISKPWIEEPSNRLLLEEPTGELSTRDISTAEMSLVPDLRGDAPGDISNDQMDFINLDGFRRAGFLGFKTVAELISDKSCLPKVKGIYFVLNPKSGLPDFMEVGSGGRFKGKDPNVPILFLQANWIEDVPVLYIGKAGYQGGNATLYSRLSQYLRFGQGKNVGHWGGRLIWQLSHCEELVICWKPLPTDDPRTVEKQLIGRFMQEFGKRPFANLVS